MNSKDFRLGNYLRKIGDKEQQKITGLHYKFVILGDGELLDWEKVEPIEVTENDVKYVWETYGYPITDCQYLHEVQNKFYYLAKIELYD
jgi:hypothetical protein